MQAYNRHPGVFRRHFHATFTDKGLTTMQKQVHSGRGTARRQALKFLAWPAAAVASLALGAQPAYAADNWPTKPIVLIVPFAAGGTTDLLARLVADGLSKGLKQNVIVENKPGAGANIGAADVARAAPDGYTLLMGTPGPLAINPFVYSQMTFDPSQAITDVSNVVVYHIDVQ